MKRVGLFLILVLTLGTFACAPAPKLNGMYIVLEESAFQNPVKDKLQTSVYFNSDGTALFVYASGEKAEFFWEEVIHPTAGATVRVGDFTYGVRHLYKNVYKLYPLFGEDEGYIYLAKVGE